MISIDSMTSAVAGLSGPLMHLPWITVIMGAFHITCVARQLSESPKELDGITTNQTYHSSRLLSDVFVGQSLGDEIAGLIAERSIARCLEAIAEILHEPGRDCKCLRDGAELAPGSTISLALKGVIPEYDWHCGNARFGRCNYLMILLHEIVDNLGRNRPSFLAEVSRTPSVRATCACIDEALNDLGADAEMVVGDWSARFLIREALVAHAEAGVDESRREATRKSAEMDTRIPRQC